MQSRAARLIVSAVALIAFIAAGAFLVHSENHLADHRAIVRAFDLHAREAADALADLRAAEQAYVAAGQGVAFWMPKVTETADRAAAIIAGLRNTSTSGDTPALLDEAAKAVTEFGNVDKRARDYLNSGQQLMAADVVFTEGATTAVAAARQVERARIAEHQELDRAETFVRQVQAATLGGAAAIGALAVLLLSPVGRRRAWADEATAEPASHDSPPRVEPATPGASARDVPSVLKSTAQICTDFGRVSDLEGLRALLASAAQVMDATGLIVWLGNTAGSDLRPVLAHGYSNQALARMPTVPRSADNAAAAAYRKGVLQIVLSHPGSSTGAIVAPLLSPEGCIGALSAEIASGGEASDGVQALAAIFAAQLAGVLSSSAAAPDEQRAAL